MTVVLFIGILIAQLLGTLLWVEQLKSSERDRLVEVSQAMGSRIGQTVEFFGKLPKQYRHIVLDQLRDMGGTRFFVSVNKSFIDLDEIRQTEFSILVRNNLQESMFAQTGAISDLNIQFVDFDNLKILSGDNLMVELSPMWKRFALLSPSDSSPVAVIQFPIDQEWLYLAAVVPKGEVLLGIEWLTTERIISISAVSFTVLLLTFLFVRWIVMPLKLLAHQADLFGKGHKPRHLSEHGSTEMVTTIRAFNSMAKRIQKYIAEREQSYAAISHDLKTPLTRARLRLEEMEESEMKNSLIGDLEYLDQMVKGSLQVMTDGTIYENPTAINLNDLLDELTSKEKILGLPIALKMQKNMIINGRIIAIERLFSNLINNALTYGKGVEIKGTKRANGLLIKVMDQGPGLSDAEKANVFEPYYRLERQLSSSHSGLGLGIVRNIVNLHGGEIVLKDRPGGGLIVEVYFPL
ncbi:MAG: ATP-binding protein [Gammaproteobacteria bacterium]|nr:ATP-binding protein [Gammaproteobacteria bacterium]